MQTHSLRSAAIHCQSAAGETAFMPADLRVDAPLCGRGSCYTEM